LRTTLTVAVVATFSALVVGSDFALSGPEFSNVKLLDTLVFVSAYVFGFRVGAAVGVVSEAVWSVVSPVGLAGAISPFLVAGELLFALAGWGASKAWRGRATGIQLPLYIGGLLAICAFVWDFETNSATALLEFWPHLQLGQYLTTVFGPLTLPFDIAHEGSDFALGAVVAPTLIAVIPKMVEGRRP
jgi:hypothetical protein